MKETLTFTTGCAINADMYYLACSPDQHRMTDDVPHSVMCFYQHQTNDKWFYHEIPGCLVTSVAFVDPAPGAVREVFALSEQGEIERYSRLGSQMESISGAGLRGEDGSLGYLSRLKSVDGVLYACGFNGQVYQRTIQGWVHADAGLIQRGLDPAALILNDPVALLEQLSASAQSSRDLMDIHGSSQADLYVVGGDGFIAHFNGVRWQILAQQTAASLNAVFVRSADEVWIAGNRGTLLKGSATSGFTVLTRKGLPVDFHAIAPLGEDIYIGASDGLYTFRNNKLQKVRIAVVEDLSEVSSVEFKDGMLWVLSSKRLLRFDGVQWDVFEHPNNH